MAGARILITISNVFSGIPYYIKQKSSCGLVDASLSFDLFLALQSEALYFLNNS